VRIPAHLAHILLGTRQPVVRPVGGNGVALSSRTGPRQGERTLLETASQVLVVEDDPVIADLLQELLVGAGHRVQCAPDVVAALSLLERHAVDLITLDIELGTYSGRALLAFLKNDPRTRAIPVIVVSSSQVEPEVRRLAEHVLNKPFSIGPFLQLVGASLQRPAPAATAWRERNAEERLQLAVAREVLE